VIRHGKRIAVETLEIPGMKPKPRRRRSDAFVMVPWAWVERLERTRNATTMKIAHRLLHLDWKSQGQPAALSNIAVARFVGRRGKWRALRELERLGLIRVERRTGSSPKIVVFRGES
jgi:hypothetical protein